MAQRRMIDHQLEPLWEPEPFLLRRGIAPVNGGFTEQQLVRELARRGWRSRLAPDRIEASKAHTSTGMVSTHIVSDESDRIAALASILVEAIRFDDRKGLLLTGPLESDIIVQTPDRQVIAIVEIKGGQSLSNEPAAKFRGNLVNISNAFALAPFLLMIWRDVGYLWDQRTEVSSTAPATLTFPMDQVVAHYLPWLHEEERPGSTELVLAVARWLNDLAKSGTQPQTPASDAFMGTDFLDAIRGATVTADGQE